MPRSPSMMSQSSCLINSLALLTPTAAGISKLLATIAVWEVLPPKSVTNPPKANSLKRNMSGGEMSWATTITSLSSLFSETVL